MTSTRDALEQKTVEQLNEMLRSKGLTVSGIKSELVQRLLDAEEKEAKSAQSSKEAAKDKPSTAEEADEDGKAVEKDKGDDDAEDNKSDEERKEASSSKDEKDEGDKDEKKDEDDKASGEGDPKEKADGEEDEKAERTDKNYGDEETKKDDEDGSEKKVTKMDKLNMSLDDLISADGWGGGKVHSKGRANDWGAGSSDWKAADNKWVDSEGSKDWKKADKYSGSNDDKWKAKEDWTSANSWQSSGGGGGGGGGGAAWQSKSADSSAGYKSSDWKSSPGGSGNGWVDKDAYKKTYSDEPKDDWKASSWVDQKGGGGGSSYTKSYDTGSYNKSYSKYDDVVPDDRRRDREPSVRRRAPRDEPRPDNKSRGPDRRTILVAGIQGLRVDSRDLERAFSAVGRVESANVAADVARITYEDVRNAAEAVRRFHGGQLNDRTIDVYFEGDEPPRTSGRGRGGRSRSRGNAAGAAPSRGGGGGGRRDGPPRSRSRSRQRRGSGGGGAMPPRSSRCEAEPERRARR